MRGLALLLVLAALAGCSYTRFAGERPDGLRVSGVALNFWNDRNLEVSSSSESGFTGRYSNTPNAELAGAAFATIGKALDKVPGTVPRLRAEAPEQ